MSFLMYRENKESYLRLKDPDSYHINLVGGDKNNNMIDEKSLIKYIEKNTMVSFQASYDDSGSLTANVANQGMNPGDLAIREGGEYNGLVIRALEEIRPILTDQRVLRAIKHLITGDVQKAIGVLRLNEEVYESGIGIVYGVLKRWLENNHMPVPKEYIDKAVPIKSERLSDWIDSYNWAPIQGAFEIAEIGYGKTSSVVPESWIGRRFENATKLHLAMDKLEWRKNKPPVNFCAIYAMSIKNVSEQYKISDIIKSKTKMNIKIGIKIIVDKKQVIRSNVHIFKNSKQSNEWLKGESVSKDLDVLVYDLNTTDVDSKLIILFKHDDLFEKKPVYEKKRSVGLLVSMMQKLLRRGPSCSRALEEVLTELWRSPGYNLPEQQFLRVSACRQLAWRLFITCIEDIQAYGSNDSNGLKNPNILSMTDLAILGMMANGQTDVQFNEFVFQKLLLVALSVQKIDKKWESLKNVQQLKDPVPFKDMGDDLLNSFIALQNYMPVREWDHFLITLSFNYIHKKMFVPAELKPMDLIHIHDDSNKVSCRDGMLAGMDMHPYPNLLIVFQGSLPFLPSNPESHTTRTLWHFIWNYSSGINFRLTAPKLDDTQQKMFHILRSIQSNLLYPAKTKISVSDFPNLSKDNDAVKINQISSLDKRVGFILLFGQKRSYSFKKKRYDIIIAGQDYASKDICKVKYLVNDEMKYLEGDMRREIEMDFLKDFSETIESPDAPLGYRWIWGDKKKVQIRSEIVKNIVKFYVDDVQVDPYDASNVLIQLDRLKSIPIPKQLEEVVQNVLYIQNKSSDQLDHYHLNLMLRKLHEKNYPVFDWLEIGKQANLPTDIWRSVYVKLYNNTDDEVLIGPVDSQGGALRDSISYLYEGTIWRIFNMFSMLYPKAVKITDAVKSLKFKILRNTAQYMDLLRCLKELCFNTGSGGEKKSDDIKDKGKNTKIQIVTKLWDHQQNTVDKILQDVSILGRRGFGDASNVGAGKTLTALSVMAGLYEKNSKTDKTSSYKSFLVLLPTTNLYKTWEDEIEKHCKGYHVVTQLANGDLTDSLRKNSILITTLGRMRDHPLTQPWIFVVIDECLSVQNKNALQTEEAWRQIITSQYGVLMASATFFRARFDKLFYMIKMLNTGLPENKRYLDAILAESIVMNVPLKTREWKESYNPFQLSTKMRKDYQEILGQNLASDKMYVKLQSFLFDNFDYQQAFADVIKRCEKDKRRCLIYTRSKEEADQFAEIKNVTRFPDVSGRHLAISYTEGTYGLNHLVYLDTIVTRFPEPDKLPQMKGRLDRPNQQNDKLKIEYIYIDETIDRAGMLRLEMANNFYTDYLMPLAEFYDIAVGKKAKASTQYDK